MRPPGPVVYVDTPLAEAARLLQRDDVAALPVLDRRGRLAGVISEHDLLEAEDGGEPAEALVGGMAHTFLAEDGGDDKTRPVSEVMERHPVTLGPDEDVSQARRLLVEYDVEVMPVVDNGVLVGVVTRQDVLALD